MTTWPPSAPGTATAAADSELLTLAVAQVLLGVRSEARWLRLVLAALPGAFPYLHGQSGDQNRLHAAWPLLRRLIRMLAADPNSINPGVPLCSSSHSFGPGRSLGAGRSGK